MVSSSPKYKIQNNVFSKYTEFLFSFFKVSFINYADILGKGTNHSLWPNNTVPYQLDAAFSSEQINLISSSLRQIELSTDYCVVFVEITPENFLYYSDYVTITVIFSFFLLYLKIYCFFSNFV